MNDYIQLRNELYHFGILGQKWGIRRYQNEDGTLTEAGKARYDSSGKLKDPLKMTNQDLRESSERLELERRYKSATGKKEKPPVDWDSKVRTQVAPSVIPSLIKGGVSFVGSYAILTIMDAFGISFKGKKDPDATPDKRLVSGKRAVKSLIPAIAATTWEMGGSIIGQKKKEDK